MIKQIKFHDMERNSQISLVLSTFAVAHLFEERRHPSFQKKDNLIFKGFLNVEVQPIEK